MVLEVFLTAPVRRPLDGDAVQRAVLVDRYLVLDWYLVLERQRLPPRVSVTAFIVVVVGAHCRRLALRPHDKHLGLRLLGRRRRREASCS